VRQWKTFSGHHLPHYFFTEKNCSTSSLCNFIMMQYRPFACWRPDAQNRMRKLHPITFVLNWLAEPEFAGESSSNCSYISSPFYHLLSRFHFFTTVSLFHIASFHHDAIGPLFHKKNTWSDQPG
jgi:hypothetical protein